MPSPVAVLIVPCSEFYLSESKRSSVLSLSDTILRTEELVTNVSGSPSARLASGCNPLWGSSNAVEFRSLRTDIENRVSRPECDGDKDDNGVSAGVEATEPRSLDFGLFEISGEIDGQVLCDDSSGFSYRELNLESTLFGTDGTVFSPQEMFGFSAQLTQLHTDGLVGGAATASAPVSNSEELDCIVCLTEQKEVLLLPCRYASTPIVTYQTNFLDLPLLVSQQTLLRLPRMLCTY
jgi:hypothetical protein